MRLEVDVEMCLGEQACGSGTSVRAANRQLQPHSPGASLEPSSEVVLIATIISIISIILSPCHLGLMNIVIFIFEH